MEMQAKGALVDSIRSRYYGARKKDKSRILDEFVAITGHQRKYTLRLLAAIQDSTAATSGVHVSFCRGPETGRDCNRRIPISYGSLGGIGA